MPLALFNGSYLGNKPTGIGVVARDLVAALDPEKFPLLDPLEGSRPYSIPIPNDLMPEFGMKAHLKRLLWTQFQLPEILKRESSPILFSPLPEAPICRGVRSIVLAHDLIPIRYPQPNFSFAYYLSYVPLVLHSSIKVVCNSEATARELNARFGIPVEKLIKIPLGFDATKLYCLDLPRQPFFLVLGRHNPHKNLSKVIEALAQLRNKDIKVWFVGPQDIRYTPNLKRKASELGVENQCRWIPWVSDEYRLQLLNTCQALIISSLWEGFGLPALEAMACETPVISSDRGALPEVIGDAGIYINPKKSVEIKNAMTSVISESSLRKKMVSNGLVRVRKFSWERCARIIEKMIKDIN